MESAAKVMIAAPAVLATSNFRRITSPSSGQSIGAGKGARP
jgi:hypothetical protein